MKTKKRIQKKTAKPLTNVQNLWLAVLNQVFDDATLKLENLKKQKL